MDAALILSAGLMGVAGVPHCAAMCGPGCAAIVGTRRVASLSFHVARVLSYSTVGALAAASVGLLFDLGRAAPWLLPLWSLLHAAAFALGLWLLIVGGQPAFIARVAPVPAAGPQPIRWQAARAGLAGALWAAWPCGLLQSAFVVASLASSAWLGAAVMAAFAVGSGAGLWWAPTVVRKLVAWTGPRGAVRLAGVLLAGGSAWALLHDFGRRAAAWCAT